MAALLFIYPHWKVSVEMGNGKPVFDQDAGRAFILSPPLAVAQTIRFPMIRGIRPVFRINYVRQFIEVGIALLFTFGLTFMLRKRGSDQSEAQKELADSGLRDLKIRVALDFCLGEEWIYLDYWGCYAHVFSEGDPKGSILSEKYLPDKNYDGFLLLTLEHVDRIIKSLKEHANDLPVMNRMGAGVERVEYFRDLLLKNPLARVEVPKKEK